MKLAFSWDDGALEDQKLFELHEKYEIPGIFFVPTRNREGRDVLSPEMMRKANSKYVTFGGHTENHTYLTEIPLEKVEPEILKNKVYLEDVLGYEIQDFCLPGGAYNSEILNIVYRHFKTCRTADTMNFRYVEGVLKPSVHFFPRGNKSLLWNATKHKSLSQLIYVAAHYGLPYFELIDHLVEREADKQESIVVIWGHSWELEENNLWEELENLMYRIKQKNPQSICEYKTIFEH